MQTTQNIIRALVIIVLLLMAVLPAAAQVAALVELVGIIEAVEGDSITVNGQTVDITTAELQVVVEVGQLVEVEGLLQTDGSIVAREVKAVLDGTVPGEFELVGVLDAINGDVIEIAGQLIDVTGAEIKPGVTVGELVKVHASITIAGWVAREVEPTVATDDGEEDSSSTNPAGEFEITGTLQEFSDDSIVISGQTISIVGAEVKNPLVLGVLVKVHVSLVDGVLVAREVENAFNEDDDSSDEDSASDDDSSDDSSSDDYSDVVIDDAETNAQEAIAIVQSIYPNTRILEIELDDLAGAGLVWEIKTSHGLEIKIEVATGAILVIDDNSDDSNDDNGDDSNDDDSNDDDGNDDDSNDDDSSDDDSNDDDSNDDDSNDDDSSDDDSDDDSSDDDSSDDGDDD